MSIYNFKYLSDVLKSSPPNKEIDEKLSKTKVPDGFNESLESQMMDYIDNYLKG